jgi:hypothetical protein
MKLTKLDKRHNGHKWFKYCVEYYHKEAKQFVDQRTWCWDTFGPSCELEFWDSAGKLGGRWCWMSTQWNTRIYFATEQEFNWYKLTYGIPK